MATYVGTSGNDTYLGTGSSDSIVGQGGNDSLEGAGGNDTIRGGDGNDTLRGGSSTDTLIGDAGFDILDGGTHSDSLNGGNIADRVDYRDGNLYIASHAGTTSVVVDLTGITGIGNSGFGTVTSTDGSVDRVLNFAHYELTSGNDSVIGSAATLLEEFRVLGGSDTLDGGAIQAVLMPANPNRIAFDGSAGAVTADLESGTASGALGTKTFARFNQLRGGPVADQLFGSGNAVWVEQFDGAEGDDTIDGRGGWDAVRFDRAASGVVVDLAAGTALDGSGGNDSLLNIEMVFGTPYADMLIGSNGANRLEGRDGNDTLEGGLGSDTLDGGAGLDTLSMAAAPAGVIVSLADASSSGGAGVDSISGFEVVLGSAFDDTLRLAGGDESARGGAGNDLLVGLAGSDTLVGDAGNDTLDGGNAPDAWTGRGGNFASYASAAAGVVADLAAGSVNAGADGVDTLIAIQGLIGSAHGDRLSGSTALRGETFEGGAGDDSIDGGAFGDPLGLLARDNNRASYAGAGAPVTVNLAAGSTSGGAGNDTLLNINEVVGTAFADTLLGSDRSDVVEAFFGLAGNDSVDGRGGFDLLRYDDPAVSGGVNASLASGTASDGQGGSDSFSNIEGLVGTPFADTLTGSARSDVVEYFAGGAGSDSIDGGAGRDMASYSGATSNVVASLVRVNFLGDTLPGSASDGQGGGDTLIGIEGLRGGPLADRLTGSPSPSLETFDGGPGADTLDGGTDLFRPQLGSGDDEADYSLARNGPVHADLWQGRAFDDGYGSVDLLIDIDHLIGSLLFGDTLIGDIRDNRLEGLGGNDSLNGGAGNDSLKPGSGDDLALGGAGFDTLVLPLARAAYGFSLDSGFFVFVNAGSSERVRAAQIEAVQFADQTASEAELQGLAPNTPTPYADRLNGAGGNDTIVALAGHDLVTGGAGDDSLEGGEGDDTLDGGTGANTVDGGAGFDTLTLAGTRLQYAVSLLEGNLVLQRAGESVLVRGIERVSFSDASVTIGELALGAANQATALADRLTISTPNQSLDAQAGDDWVVGSVYADTISGGDGDDTLFGGPGADSIVGGTNNEPVFDSVSYADAAGAVAVDLAQRSAAGAAGNDWLFGFEGVTGSDFDDAINGDADRNQLHGGDGNDTLTGDAGDDTLTGGIGNDLLDGGAGRDATSYLEAPAGVTVTLAADSASAGSASDGLGGTDVLPAGGIEIVIGSAHADLLTGSPRFTTDGEDVLGDDELRGDDGNDTLRGLSGDDTLAGGSGNDSIVGGEGRNWLFGGGGNDTLDGRGGLSLVAFDSDALGSSVNLGAGTADGGEGADTLIEVRGAVLTFGDDDIIGDAMDNLFIADAGHSSGEDFDDGDLDDIDGEGGFDTISYERATTGVEVDLAAGRASGEDIGTDRLFDLEAVIGSDFLDELTGDALANRLDGGSGNDRLIGNAGNDTLVGGYDNDSIDGGAGEDWLFFDDATDAVVVNLRDSTASGQGSDTVGNIEHVLGSAFGDVLTGDDDDNSLVGGAGDDSFIGRMGADTLDGGPGADVVDYSEAPAAVSVDLSGIDGDGSVGSGTASDGEGSTDTLRNIQIVYGSAFDDTLVGSPARVVEQFEGGPGNDTVDGGEIVDPFTGRSGNLLLYWSSTQPVQVDLAAGTATGDGNDSFTQIDRVRGSDHDDTLLGSDRSDLPEQLEGMGGDDILDGRGGMDWARFGQSPGPVVASLVTGTAADGWGGTDMLIGIEGLIGSDGDDSLAGGAAANGTTAIGDLLSDGLEVFQGNAGDDSIDGGQGYDLALYRDAPGSIALARNNDGSASVTDGEGGTDALAGVEGVVGSAFADSLSGSDAPFEVFAPYAGDDLIDGRGGIDVLDFGWDEHQGARANLATRSFTDGFDDSDTATGIEWLWGTWSFADELIGDDGPNRLDGRGGDDTLTGGGGNDTLVPGTGDDSVDGGGGDDTLWLPGLLTDYTLTRLAGGRVRLSIDGGDESITFIGIESVAFADQTIQTDQLGGSSSVPTPYADTLQGSAAADAIDALAGNDQIAGGAGDDTLTGGAGNDTLDGGEGWDSASYADAAGAVDVDLGANRSSGAAGDDRFSGIERLAGSAFADRLAGDDMANELSGGSGDDTLLGNAGNDTLLAGAGQDSVDGGGGDDRLQLASPLIDYAFTVLEGGRFRLSLGDGGDSVTYSGIEWVAFADQVLASDQVGGSRTVPTVYADTLQGGDGADSIDAQAGNDKIAGGAGDDTLVGGPGRDTLDGGDGWDSADYSAAEAAIVVELGAGSASGGAGDDQLEHIERVVGSAFADRLVGDAAADQLEGRGGDDTLLGGLGNDTLLPGTGVDSVDGGAGDDSLQLPGALADYSVALLDGGLWQLTAVGSTDRVVFTGVEQIAFADQTVAADQLGGSSSVPTPFGDTLQGSDAADAIDALAGNDQIAGGAGDDTLTGGPGNDTLNGGDGLDTASYAGAAGPVDVDLAANRSSGAAGDDRFGAIERLVGSAFADRLAGDAAQFNFFEGGAGNDTIDGGPTEEGGFSLDIVRWRTSAALVVDLASGTADQAGESDRLIGIEVAYGGDGADHLLGSERAENLRDNTLRGGAGNDTLEGRSGVDSAEFIGARDGYQVQRNPTTGVITVTDLDPSGVNEGIDTLIGIERLVFADRMLAFGTRAEELARVAFTLWSPDIVVSAALFCRGLSFFDVGYDLDTTASVALQFWPKTGRDFAIDLVASSRTTKSVDQVLAIMAANGGDFLGRAAAVKALAIDAEMTAQIETSGIRSNGLEASLFVPGFGQLFDLLPG